MPPRGKLDNYTRLASEDFRIVLLNNQRGAGHLWSRHLDRKMHGGPSVPIWFGDTSEEMVAGNIVLDAFQLQSLSDYLKRQDVIRRDLEAASMNEPALQGLGNASGPKMWTKLRVCVLLLPERSLKPTMKVLRETHRTDLARSKTAWDTANTKSSWQLVFEHRKPGLRSKSWQDGHQRFCQFRDGRFVEAWLEG